MIDNRSLNRIKRISKHLYEAGMEEGYDYIICPVTKLRRSMIKVNYITGVLKMSVEDFKERFPDQQFVCRKRSENIRRGINLIDSETGLTKHQLSVNKSKISRNIPNEDGITPNQKIGINTKKAHLKAIDENGLNGYQRQVKARLNTVLENGLTVQKNSLLKNYETRRRNGTKMFNNGASKASKIALAPVLRWLNDHEIKYYFDDTEYGIRTDTNYYLYDLTIPSLSIAIEFQGKGFHPCISLLGEDRKKWRQVFTNKTASEISRYDKQKREALWRTRNIATFYVYETTSTRDISDLMVTLQEKFTHISEPIFVENTEWEIETPNGWCDFKGIIRKGIMEVKTLCFTDQTSVSATPSHQFFQEGIPVKLEELRIGDVIDGETSVKHISSIKDGLESNVFDLVEVDNENHAFVLSNGVITKNCDELAFAAPNLVEAMFTSLSPTLATGGKAIITSTPRTDTDMFATIWKGANDSTDQYGNVVTQKGEGKNGYFPYTSIWSDHPDRDQEWADKEIATIGKSKFLQEHECRFITDEETLIDGMCLSRLKTIDPISYTGQIRWYLEPIPNKSYMIALDPAEGTGGDFAAIQVFMLPELIQVAEWQHNKTDVRGQVRIMLQLLHTLQGELLDHPEQSGEPDLYWTFENNSIGQAVIEVVTSTGEEKFPGQMISERKKKGTTRKFKKGLTTTTTAKRSSCVRLKSLIESDRMIVNSNQSLRELKSFIAKGSSYSAKQGQHDDLVSALLLITRMLDIIMGMGLEATSDDLRESISEDEIFGAMPVVI